MPETLLHTIRFDVCLLADALRIQIAQDQEPHDMPELIKTVFREYVRANLDGLSITTDAEKAYNTLLNTKIIRRKRKPP